MYCEFTDLAGTRSILISKVLDSLNSRCLFATNRQVIFTKSGGTNDYLATYGDYPTIQRLSSTNHRAEGLLNLARQLKNLAYISLCSN
jgi:hypothetical protein